MKTYKELIAESASIVTDIIGPAELRILKKYAHQTTSAYQSTMENVLSDIETELNKFGYSLGELDMTEGFDDEGSEDFYVLSVSTKELVKNIYIAVEWETVSGQQFAMRPDGSKLRLDVTMKIVEVDPSSIDELMDEDGIEREVIESIEDIEESLKFHRAGVWGKGKNLGNAPDDLKIMHKGKQVGTINTFKGENGKNVHRVNSHMGDNHSIKGVQDHDDIDSAKSFAHKHFVKESVDDEFELDEDFKPHKPTPMKHVDVNGLKVGKIHAKTHKSDSSREYTVHKVEPHHVTVTNHHKGTTQRVGKNTFLSGTLHKHSSSSYRKEEVEQVTEQLKLKEVGKNLTVKSSATPNTMEVVAQSTGDITVHIGEKDSGDQGSMFVIKKADVARFVEKFTSFIVDKAKLHESVEDVLEDDREGKAYATQNKKLHKQDGKHLYTIFHKHHKVSHRATNKAEALSHAKTLFKPKKNETVGAWKMKHDGSYDEHNQD